MQIGRRVGAAEDEAERMDGVLCRCCDLFAMHGVVLNSDRDLKAGLDFFQKHRAAACVPASPAQRLWKCDRGRLPPSTKVPIFSAKQDPWRCMSSRNHVPG